MIPFLFYIARSSLYLAVFYAFFLLVMRRTSLFSFNRITLLAGTAVCFALPFVRLRTESASAAVVDATAVAAGPLEAVGVAAEPLQTASAASGPAPLLLLYVAGAATVLVLTALSVLRLRRILRSGRTTRGDGYLLTVLDSDAPSFSWGRRIAICRRDLESSPAILTHERMHVRKRHSLDIAFFSVVTVLHWFNPLVWITFSELKLLHEYEADDAVINQGIDATQYQLLMVKKAVGEHRFSLANGFLHSNLKNRIAMMIKPHTSGWMRLSYVAILPVLAALMFACNPAREQQAEQLPAGDRLETKAGDAEMPQADAEKGESIPFQLVEVKPTFNGGDANEFSKWISENLSYPEAAKASGAQGRVTLQFVVGPDGKVGNVKVLRGASEELDAEALRVVSSSPDWTPGMMDGKPVSVTYTFPVIFSINEGEAGDTKGTSDAVPFSTIEVKPTFNGGDSNEFSKWVASQMKYPEAAKAAGVSGRVLVSFVVGPDGSVGDVRLLRGVSDELDAEALRVIKASPKWEPGKQNGKAVSVTYTFPVIFRLQ